MATKIWISTIFEKKVWNFFCRLHSTSAWRGLIERRLLQALLLHFKNSWTNTRLVCTCINFFLMLNLHNMATKIWVKNNFWKKFWHVFPVVCIIHQHSEGWLSVVCYKLYCLMVAIIRLLFISTIHTNNLISPWKCFWEKVEEFICHWAVFHWMFKTLLKKCVSYNWQVCRVSVNVTLVLKEVFKN